MAPRKTNENVRLPDVSRPADEDAGSRTLRRGLQVLEAVMSSPDGLRVVDLCRASGLERAPVYRLLATLMEGGHVARRGRFLYVAGPRWATQQPPARRPNMAVHLQPVLERVSRACGDAAFAILREGPSSHCIARHVGS